MRIRIGKVARLPLTVRDQLNRRLQDGAPYDHLIGWLADQGHPGFIRMNLSRWRHGGYLDWLAHQQLPSPSGSPPPSPKPAETVQYAFEAWLYNAMQTMHPDDWARLLAEHPGVFLQLLQAYTAFSRSVLSRRKQEHQEQRQHARGQSTTPAPPAYPQPQNSGALRMNSTPPPYRSVSPNIGFHLPETRPDPSEPSLVLDIGIEREICRPKMIAKLFSSAPCYREATLSVINGM